MWIKTTVLLYGILTIVVAIDEHRSKNKDDGRGKRNLQYSIAHHYNGPYSYQLERRISTGPQLPIYPITSQYYPGPSKYHKGRPYSSYPPPPYAVQMEPLIHYSQRDPLFDSNILSLNTDGPQQHHHADDLLTDPTNHLNDNIYGPPHIVKQHQQTKIIEKPVYIKEPEPIIEIIIKESNVTLPPLPTPPPPPPKKKEQVQVFYVKYKKNPNGYGKDSVIYEKPIPAISQPVQDEHEETVPDYGPPQEVVTSPPPPSTTLRTIIKPDSEVYHSPSGIKVTFGKEGFDYDKRSNKPEELNQERSKVQFPQARQLSSFPNAPSPPTYQRRPVNFNYNPLPPASSQPPTSNYRQPQPYRPFHQSPEFRQNQFNRPNPQQYSTLPRFAQLPQQRHPPPPPPRPIPPQIPRQPVPYQPFENLRNPNQPQIQFRPQSQYPINQQLPLNQQPTFNQYSSYQPQPPNHPPQQIQQRPQSAQTNLNYQPFQQQQQHQKHFVQQLPQHAQPNFSQLTQQVPFSQQQVQFNNHRQPAPSPSPQPQRNPPPGGELIHSVPKFEQHISVLETNKNQQPQALPLQNQARNHLTQEEYNQKIQQQFHQASVLQESIRQNNPPNQYFNQFYQTTPRVTTTTTTQRTTTTTTTPIPEISTTTKDPKILNAQLPDEVPDDLRQQLLSSGILNNADISILDYDKVGDIPLSALPPEQLANFYSAGGAQQIGSGSAPVPSYVDKNGAIIRNIQSQSDEEIVEDEQIEGAASEIDEVRVKPASDVEMKVVHYNPETEQGQQIQQSYVKDDAKQVDPVVLNGEQYNRYLPLKVSGQQFPIPDVPELKGKKISSVVVLAPITYDFANSRPTRDTKPDDFELIKNEALLELLKNPTSENYKKFLERENQTRSDQQAVILLVAGDPSSKEIFMYDVATKTVSRLDGELSAAFVEAAEANAATDEDQQQPSASNIVETRVPYPNNKIDRNIELDSEASDIIETNIPIIDPISATSELDTQASEHLESFVDVSGMPIVDNNDDDLTVAASEIRTIGSNSILVSTGGKTGS